MKNTKLKIIITAFVVVLMIAVCAIPCFAQFDLTGHYDPTGTTSTYYAYSPSECNRTINVSMYDLAGNFLKKVVLKTKHGEDNSFHIGIGGYDIVNFSSDQGLWETCKLVWTSGTGLCTEADIFINYYFRTGLSQNEINVRVEMRKWDPISISVKHYVETDPTLNYFHRETYQLHSTDQQMIKDYYDYFYTSKKTITGYTLRAEYKSSISGNFCYNALVGKYENCPSSPRCHSYDLHLTDWNDGMDHWSTYKESKHGRIDWCDNREFWVEYFYDLNEYTITYDANGGTGAPSSQTKYYGMDMALSDSIPTRSGYTFKGWGTSSNSSYASYQPGGNYTSNTSRTLYAIWESNAPKTYTVSYNANGGTGAPVSQTKTQGVTLTLSSVKPERNGYSFLGWSANSYATSPTYYAGGAYTANASITLYAVWLYNVPTTYVVSFDANGGSGAPETQTKTYGVNLTLSSAVPIRDGYNFLGWGTSSTATSAAYQPGDSYTANASITLYAIWEKTNYDFSVSDLSVSNSEPYQYDQITVSVRCDSWDKVNAYKNIPIQLYYGGRLISTQYADFPVYGLANITFTLNVGKSVGNQTIEVCINWENHNSETRTGNNTVSALINVQDYDYEVSIDSVVFSDSYCEGTEVISSFYVHNDSDYDIIPSYHNTARFIAYYDNGADRTVICTQDWEDVVIPAGGTNLVYFKWRVPMGFAGRKVSLECTINADRQMNEDNYRNNTALLTTTVSRLTESQTPDTRFENQAPGTYQSANVPYETSGRATWTVWEYENGGFVLKKYGIQVSPESPEVVPGMSCTTAVYESSTWRMRSGYGIAIRYMPDITTVSGYLRPEVAAYTMPQLVVATFPEYRYSDASGNCRTLEYADGMYRFIENANADGNERLHFIPVYVQDGNYVVSVTVTQIWTPAGMITAVRNSAPIMIDGTVYDDWYQ